MVAIIKYTYTHTYVKQITWVSEDVEKLDPSWTAASGKVNWYNRHGKRYGISSKNQTQLPPDPAIPRPGVCPAH